MKKQVFKKARTYILFVIVIIGLFFYFNSKAKITSLVNKTSIVNRVVNKTVSASGSVKSRNEADMSFSSGGQLRYLYVSEGQKIITGQLLASIDNQSQSQTLQYYKDAWDIAIKEKELFKNNKDQNIDLLHGEKAYNIKLEEYNQQISQAEANYKIYLSALGKTNIYAPFNATVIEITKKIGENAAANETVVKVADLDKLYFEISVDQSDYGNIKTGQETILNFDSYDGLDFNGAVNELPTQANPDSSDFTVKVDINKTPDLNLWIGMTGDAYMITQSSVSEVPSLIYNEIQKDEVGKPFVWVVDNGRIAKQYIDVGIEGDIYTEVKTKVDKQIVVPSSDGEQIKEGYIAKVIN